MYEQLSLFPDLLPVMPPSISMKYGDIVKFKLNNIEWEVERYRLSFHKTGEYVLRIRHSKCCTELMHFCDSLQEAENYAMAHPDGKR